MIKFLMPLICPIDNIDENRIFILCDSELSKKAHKELFRYEDNIYEVVDNKDVLYKTKEIIDLLNSSPSSIPSKIHVVLNWANILKILLWQSENPTGEMLLVLRNFGLKSEELNLFKNCDVGDIFFYLYYGKRFDVLRKVCHSAKRQIEKHLRNNFIKVDSHIVAEDTGRIVASSL